MFVPGPDVGAKLASAFGTLFKTDVPPAAKPEALEPVHMDMAVLGEEMSADLGQSPGGNWTAGKLFMEEPGIDAEIFFNYDLADGVGKFSEKDPDYRSDIVYFIAEHFRDGPRLRRTPADDPNLAKDGPKIEMVGMIPQSAGCTFEFVRGGDWLTMVTSEPDRNLRLVNMADLSKVIDVGHFEGLITVHPLDSEAKRLVVDEIVSSNSHEYSSDDEHRIWLVDREAGTKTQITRTWPAKNANVESVSDDGRFVALANMSRGADGKWLRAIYFLDLEKHGTAQADTDEFVDGWIGSGDSTQAVLKTWDKEQQRFTRAISPITLQGNVITDAQVPAKLRDGASPDGRQRYVVHRGESLEFVGADGTSAGKFVFHPDDERFANEDVLKWVNSRYALFDGMYPALIDSEKLKMSYLPEELDTAKRYRFSDDFLWLVIGEKDGVHVGRVVSPKTQP